MFPHTNDTINIFKCLFLLQKIWIKYYRPYSQINVFSSEINTVQCNTVLQSLIEISFHNWVDIQLWPSDDPVVSVYGELLSGNKEICVEGRTIRATCSQESLSQVREPHFHKTSISKTQGSSVTNYRLIKGEFGKSQGTSSFSTWSWRVHFVLVSDIFVLFLGS